MATKTPQQSFFENFSIPQVSRQSVLDDRRKMMLSGAAQQGGGAGMLGAMLGAKLAPAKLSNEEEQRFAIKDRADAAYSGLLGTAAFKNMSQSEQRFAYQDELAKATASVNPQLASEMFQRNTVEKQQWAKGQAELEKLDMEKEAKEAARDKSRNDMRLSNIAEWQPFAVANAEGGGWNLDNQITARRQEDGQFVDTDGNIIDPQTVMPYEDAKEIEEESKEARLAALGGTMIEREGAFRSASTKEIERTKAISASAASSNAVVQKVVDRMIHNIEVKGITPEQYLGLAGKSSNLVDDMLSVFGATRETLKDVTLYDVDENPIGTVGDMTPDAKETLSAIGVENADLQGNIIELAFAVARMHEPNGKLSDNDFQIALKRIGGSYNNPQKLAATLQSLIGSNRDAYMHQVASIETNGASFNLPKGRATEMILGENFNRQMDDYNKLADSFTQLGEVLANKGFTEKPKTEEEQLLDSSVFSNVGSNIPDTPAPAPDPTPTVNTGSKITTPKGTLIEMPGGGSIQFR